jgi:hypothetical protein
MPIVTARGTRIGPVALVCATVCFLGSLAAILYLIHNSNTPDDYIRPIITGLITVGTGAVLYWRTHENAKQNVILSSQVAEVDDKAAEAAKQLDGTLDMRIRQGVIAALGEHETRQKLNLPPPEGN